MKNSNNPYTVPENFFEDISNQTISAYRNKRRAVHCGIAAMVVAAAILIIPVFIRSIDEKAQEQTVVANNLADMYEYDIFLQVNF